MGTKKPRRLARLENVAIEIRPSYSTMNLPFILLQ